MATQDKNRLAGKYDRRVELIRPINSTNSFNEPLTSQEVVYSNFPAKKFDLPSGDGESKDGNIVQVKIEIDWEIRFIPGLTIDTTWKIRDMHDGQVYEITSPPTEVGRREGIKLKTKVVQ